MATKTTKNSKKKKLTPEETRAINAAQPARNKFVEAARKSQGNFIIYDPAFML
ncbi:MAG: hypothetical protein J1F13_07095 [Prevotellaceae bacterium]|nr:hypothetical protein [Prevotellaceae bacterium]